MAANNEDFFKKFSDSIEKQYFSDCQTKQVYDSKQEALYQLESCAKQCIGASGFKNKMRIWLTGSSINGFGNKNSDADMCLVTGNSTGEALNRKQIVNLLHQMRRNLDSDRRFMCRRAEVIPAKVPILRVFLNMDRSEVQCDVNVDNHIGIRNSWLLRCYSELDPRVRPFIYMLKKFAKAADLNDAQSGSLSTYSWLLLAIGFLQYGLEHPVVPVVQSLKHKDGRLYDEHFKAQDLQYVTKMALEVQSQIKWKSKNTMTCGELFYRFIYFYAQSFNFMDWIISVRLGKLMMRFGPESIDKLHKSIRASQESLSTTPAKKTKRPRLNSGIFVKSPKPEDTVEISDSEGEEHEESSIVKKTSSESDGEQEENEEEGETVKAKHPKKAVPKATTNETELDSGADVQVISSEEEEEDEDEEVDDTEMYNQAVKIFGSEANALLLHPNVKNKSSMTGHSTDLDEYENKLILSQRLLIEKAATRHAHFNFNDFPPDRITICIEEPFQKDNVARAVFDKEKALRIIKSLRYMRQKIEEVRERKEILTLTKVNNLAAEYLKTSDEQISRTIQGRNRKRRLKHDMFTNESESNSDSDRYHRPQSKRFKNAHGMASTAPMKKKNNKFRPFQKIKKNVQKTATKAFKATKIVTKKSPGSGGPPKRGKR